MLTLDERKVLRDLVSCVKLIGWHVAELQHCYVTGLRHGEGKIAEGWAVTEINEVLENLEVIQRVIETGLQP